ncbi:MAG: hydrogenase 3 maturation endopeptidase HyCI [Gammaproteobacteria bacterium]|nr:hydrogenase 3 maturation endopeptidase HyCI [Gammaproteobacteria bacterium]
MLDRQLNEFLGHRAAVLGIGNRLWGDDGAGSRLAAKLEDRDGRRVIDGGAVPENHLRAVAESNPNAILLIDAADFGGRPGECRLLSAEELAGQQSLSTHAGSPRLLAEYLHQRTGARVALLAIQPASNGQGDRLSAEVARTVARLAEAL